MVIKKADHRDPKQNTQYPYLSLLNASFRNVGFTLYELYF
jgi:hypothetical protein